MKNLKFIFLIIVFFSACNKEESDLAYDNTRETSYEVIIKERDSRYPLKLQSDSFLERKKNSESVINARADDPTLSFMNYLGRGYNVKGIPLGDPANVSISPIINIEKLRQSSDESYLSKQRYLLSEATISTFSNYERYVNSETVRSKVQTGASINFLNIFSLGAKKTTETMFSSHIDRTDSTAYGELNINLNKNIYRLQAGTEYVNQKLSLNYLHRNFIEDLYNSSITELVNTYGQFVLKGFVTGGKSSAIYGSKFFNSITQTSREVNLMDSISGGFKLEDSGGNLNISLGRQEGSSSSDTQRTSEIYISMKTIGGTSLYPNFTIPVKFGDLNINLSAWGKSLDDSEQNHELIDITENGLLPLSDIIIEKDLKDGIINYITNETWVTSLQEPYLNVRENNSRVNGTTYSVTLRSRLGYTISLKFDRTTLSTDLEALKAYISSYFKALRITLTNGGRLDSVVTADEEEERYKYNFVLDSSKMKKYINPANGITYILCDDATYKTGFAIFDNFILDTYGIRDLVNSLPTVDLSLQQLVLYDIYSL